jgi:transcriptional regulator with XRE-family HTH domain
MLKQAADFARPLRPLREAAGISCNELARRAGVSDAAVSMLENNLRKPSLETARKLARALGQTSLAWWD